MTRNDHYYHSALVRNMQLQALGLHTKTWDYTKEKTHSLVSPHEGFVIRMSFSEASEYPDLILIRSTNWRAEHEPSGWVTRERAREIWKILKRHGFIEEA